MPIFLNIAGTCFVDVELCGAHDQQ